MVHMCESCELAWIIMSPYLLVIANCVARSVTFWPIPVQTCPNQIGSNPSGVVHRLFLHSLIFSEFPQELSSHLTWKETPSLMVTFLTNFPWNMVTARGYVNHAMAQPPRLHANAAHSHALQPSSARRQRSQPHEPCGWWKKSGKLTSWGWSFIPLFTRFLYIPRGAGFLPSTVWLSECKLFLLLPHYFQFQRSLFAKRVWWLWRLHSNSHLLSRF